MAVHAVHDFATRSPLELRQEADSIRRNRQPSKYGASRGLALDLHDGLANGSPGSSAGGSLAGSPPVMQCFSSRDHHVPSCCFSHRDAAPSRPVAELGAAGRNVDLANRERTTTRPKFAGRRAEHNGPGARLRAREPIADANGPPADSQDECRGSAIARSSAAARGTAVARHLHSDSGDAAAARSTSVESDGTPTPNKRQSHRDDDNEAEYEIVRPGRQHDRGRRGDMSHRGDTSHRGADAAERMQRWGGARQLNGSVAHTTPGERCSPSPPSPSSAAVGADAGSSVQQPDGRPEWGAEPTRGIPPRATPPMVSKSNSCRDESQAVGPRTEGPGRQLVRPLRRGSREFSEEVNALGRLMAAGPGQLAPLPDSVEEQRPSQTADDDSAPFAMDPSPVPPTAATGDTLVLTPTPLTLVEAESDTVGVALEPKLMSKPVPKPDPEPDLAPDPEPDPEPDLAPDPKPDPEPNFGPEPAIASAQEALVDADPSLEA